MKSLVLISYMIWQRMRAASSLLFLVATVLYCRVQHPGYITMNETLHATMTAMIL